MKLVPVKIIVVADGKSYQLYVNKGSGLFTESVAVWLLHIEVLFITGEAGVLSIKTVTAVLVLLLQPPAFCASTK